MHSGQWLEKIREEYDPLEERMIRAQEYMYSIAPRWCRGCDRLRYNKYDELYCEDPKTDEIHYINTGYDKSITCPIIKAQIKCKQYRCAHIIIDEIDRYAACENECKGEKHGTNEENTGTERIQRAC